VLGNSTTDFLCALRACVVQAESRLRRGENLSLINEEGRTS
jgi:hypothetical protein